jgi:hypothetical protein
MSSSLLDVAFAHHVWATLRLIDACLARSAEELETSSRHAGTDARNPSPHRRRDTEDLYILTGDRAFDIDIARVACRGSRRHGA